MAKPLLHNLTAERWCLIKRAACKLDVPAEHLAAVIAFETAELFSPQTENPLSGAVGLIQFTKVGYTSIKDRGYSFHAIGQMNFEAQLMGPVIDYFRANRGVGLQGLADLYMCVLAPKAIGKSAEFQLYVKPTKAYNQNKGLDRGGKGYITKEDAAEQVSKKLVKVNARVKTLCLGSSVGRADD